MKQPGDFGEFTLYRLDQLGIRYEQVARLDEDTLNTKLDLLQEESDRRSTVLRERRERKIHALVDEQARVLDLGDAQRASLLERVIRRAHPYGWDRQCVWCGVSDGRGNAALCPECSDRRRKTGRLPSDDVIDRRYRRAAGY